MKQEKQSQHLEKNLSPSSLYRNEIIVFKHNDLEIYSENGGIHNVCYLEACKTLRHIMYIMDNRYLFISSKQGISIYDPHIHKIVAKNIGNHGHYFLPIDPSRYTFLIGHSWTISNMHVGSINNHYVTNTGIYDLNMNLVYKISNRRIGDTANGVASTHPSNRFITLYNDMECIVFDTTQHTTTDMPCKYPCVCKITYGFYIDVRAKNTYILN